MKHIVVIDGQGGGMGRQIISAIKEKMNDAYVMAVGTNSMATAAMLKAGADAGATGENAVIVACKKADYIVGPIGIVIADSLYGEITANMSAAVGQSMARKVLLPVNLCDNIVVGIPDLSVSKLISFAVSELMKQQL